LNHLHQGFQNHHYLWLSWFVAAVGAVAVAWPSGLPLETDRKANALYLASLGYVLGWPWQELLTMKSNQATVAVAADDCPKEVGLVMHYSVFAELLIMAAAVASGLLARQPLHPPGCLYLHWGYRLWVGHIL
jgi:hypothetical protein